MPAATAPPAEGGVPVDPSGDVASGAADGGAPADPESASEGSKHDGKAVDPSDDQSSTDPVDQTNDGTETQGSGPSDRPCAGPHPPARCTPPA